MPTYYLAPDPCQSTFFLPGTNTPGNGVKVFTYATGTSTKVSVAADPAGAGLQTNPIILDSGGNLPSASSMYIEAGVAIDVVYAPANDSDPPVSPYRTVTNVVGVPTNTVSTTQWTQLATPTYVSGTQFRILGDQTAVMHPGRRIKTQNTGGAVYSTISSSVFATSTTVGLHHDSTSLDSGLSAAYYGILSATDTSLPGFVDVRNFGVKADGVTVDTAAMATAVASGHSLELPEGTMLIGSNIRLTKPGQAIVGKGAMSIFQATSGTYNLFTAEAENVTFRSVRFNGGANSSTTTQYAVFTATTTPAETLKFVDCIFSGSSATVGLNNCVKWDTGSHSGFAIQNIVERLQGSAASTGYGFLVGDADYFVGFANKGTGSTGRGRHLIYISAGASYAVVAKNRVTDFDEDGITQYATASQDACEGNIYEGNIILRCAQSGTLDSAAMGIYGRARGSSVRGNIILESGNHGITVNVFGATDTLDTNVGDNTVLYSQKVGINAVSPTGLHIADNIVRESSQSSAGLHSNINITSNSTTSPARILITGNDSSGTTTARSALRFDPSASTASGVKISGNYFPTCNFADIELNGTVAPIDGWLRHSETYDPPSVGANSTYTYASIIVPGCKQGDLAIASHTHNDAVSITAYVTTTNTVSVLFANSNPNAKDIANGTLRIGVQPLDF